MKTCARSWVASLLLLAACSGSDPESGKVQIAITDAAGDFHTYAVDVSSIALKRADGATVETLPNATRVDFAEYVELAELFTVRTVPVGTYTGMRLTLDYADAQIMVENAAGDTVAVTAVNEAGAALATLTVDVDFGPRDRMTIVPGVPAHVTLDFDLAASHRLNDLANPTTVTVLPVLFADAQLNDDRPYRLRGVVEAVSVAESQFALDLRPFDQQSGDFGDIRVEATGATRYEISGQHYVGTPGLQALAALALPARAVVFGHWDRARHQFVALLVFAGNAVGDGTDDFVRGHVLARTGNALTVLGLLADRDEDRAVFGRTITVDVTGATVFKEGTGPAAIGDISVGQRVDVLGDHDSGSGDAAHVTARYVRLRVTDLGGTVVQAGPQLVVDLQSFGRVPAGRFNFAGTGSPDADPDHYEVDTGLMLLAGVEPGDPVRVRGFVAPFGAAPPDFEAVTVLNASQMPARLGINWKFPGSTAAFPVLEATQLVADLDNPDLGLLHHVRRAGVFTDLVALDGDLTIVPTALGRYAIVEGGPGRTVTVFGNFADFSSALTLRLAAGSRAWILGAGGRFDDATVTFTAPGAAVVLVAPPP
ncbi:MAG: DUF4382 domain-containing protein [Gammaproteobacteria bacterium]